MTGIVSYGTYIPKYRIKTADIAAAWQKDAGEIVSGLGVQEKSVPAIDEDAVTIALEAASQCLSVSGSKASDIEAMLIGSESHPYAVNPSSTIVGELLGVGTDYFAADLEFACKAGTAGMVAIMGMLAAKQIALGMAIGADTAQGRPHDVLEYTAAAAGSAVLLGRTNCIAECMTSVSFSSDTPDFWRRDGMRYPSHAGRFTGEPAYFTHVLGAAGRLFQKIHRKPADIDYCVFHMPNGKFPREAAKRLGFTGEQLAPSLTVDSIGNPYSASSLVGLSAVLDIAKPGQTIFMVSYGSGAGSDGFLWKTTPRISAFQKKREKKNMLVSQQIIKKQYVNYLSFLKKTHKI